jgi:hypothetical protein
MIVGDYKRDIILLLLIMFASVQFPSLLFAEENTENSWQKAGKEIKEAAGAIGEASQESWENTKKGGKAAWEKTKEVSAEAVTATKEGGKNLWEQTKDTSQKVVAQAKGAFQKKEVVPPVVENEKIGSGVVLEKASQAESVDEISQEQARQEVIPPVETENAKAPAASAN